MSKRQMHATVAMALVTMGGKQVPVMLSKIKGDEFDQHSGKTAAGVEVSTISTVILGDQGKQIIALKKKSGRIDYQSLDDFEIAARNVLKGLGYTVTHPAISG